MNYLTYRLNKEFKRIRKHLKRSKKRGQKALLYLLILLLSQFFPWPTAVLADENPNPNQLSVSQTTIAGIIDIDSATSTPENTIKKENNPPVPSVKIIKSSVHKITAYNSEVGQTDDSPCITANGFNLCSHGEEDSIAANFLEFGTRVRIPELFGDKVFVVRDRMNPKHPERIDIWMKSRRSAVNFGVKVAKIEVLADADIDQ